MSELNPSLNKVAIATLFCCCSLLFGLVVNAEPFGGNGGSGGGQIGIHIGGVGSGGIPIGGGAGGGSFESRCPRVCSCSGQTVDCSHRGLTQVPRKIPSDTERL